MVSYVCYTRLYIINVFFHLTIQNHSAFLAGSSYEVLEMMAQKSECIDPESSLKILNLTLSAIKNAFTGADISAYLPDSESRIDFLIKSLQCLRVCISHTKGFYNNDKAHILQTLVDIFNLPDAPEEVLGCVISETF